MFWNMVVFWEGAAEKEREKRILGINDSSGNLIVNSRGLVS